MRVAVTESIIYKINQNNSYANQLKFESRKSRTFYSNSLKNVETIFFYNLCGFCV